MHLWFGMETFIFDSCQTLSLNKHEFLSSSFNQAPYNGKVLFTLFWWSGSLQIDTILKKAPST